MQNKQIFRQQNVVRAFAFACAVSAALAGSACTSLGAASAPTQSDIAKACGDAETALGVASFLEAKMTAAELKVFQQAEVAVPIACSPSAQAAYATPAAITTAIGVLGGIVSNLQGLGVASPS